LQKFVYKIADLNGLLNFGIKHLDRIATQNNIKHFIVLADIWYTLIRLLIPFRREEFTIKHLDAPNNTKERDQRVIIVDTDAADDIEE